MGTEGVVPVTLDIRVLVVLKLLACPLWALAQAPAPPAVAPAPPGTSALADSELQLVVALFRHGVHAPSVAFGVDCISCLPRESYGIPRAKDVTRQTSVPWDQYSNANRRVLIGGAN